MADGDREAWFAELEAFSAGIEDAYSCVAFHAQYRSGLDLHDGFVSLEMASYSTIQGMVLCVYLDFNPA